VTLICDAFNDATVQRLTDEQVELCTGCRKPANPQQNCPGSRCVGR